MATQATGRGRREVLFLLSTRLFDLDTYLPTAMEMKAARPGWNIRFVCFSQATMAMVGRNPTLAAGIAHCGTLYNCGADQLGPGRLRKLRGRIQGFLRIGRWILAAPGPVVVLCVPFARPPYKLWYWLARLRAGKGIVMLKHRGPDEVHRMRWWSRGHAHRKARQRGLWARLGGRDQDAIVHYHGLQSELVAQLAPHGRIAGTPLCRIGLPHLFPAWRAHIEAETVRARRALVAEGVPEGAEIYAFFAAKPGSSTYLRGPDSVARAFLRPMAALKRLRPHAQVLIRPHPRVANTDYMREGMAMMGPGQARLSLAHPEVLLRLARRAFANNPTNIIFNCFEGRIIETSEYSDSYYRKFGHESPAHGLGALFLAADRPDFEERLAEALADDTPFERPEIGARRAAVMRQTPPDIGPLIALVEAARPAPAAGIDIRHKAKWAPRR